MSKRIKTQITQIKKTDYTDIRGLRFTGITDDSRNVKKGDIFFAIEGARFDGRKFIEEAVKKGAKAIVVSKARRVRGQGFHLRRGFGGQARVIRVDNPRVALAKYACDFYGNPSKKIKVIGITGTNGKTTISYLLSNVFKKAGYEAGIIGTIVHCWKDNVTEAQNTTPGSIELQRLLSKMVSDGVSYCAMEVSSHSLDQDRVFGIDFNTAIFTNITSEHLDYHKTFENYLEAKIKLFRDLKSDRLAILNVDDKSLDMIRKNTSSHVMTYGLDKKADVFADEIKIGLDKTEFLVRTKKGSFKVATPLIGIFNIYNILAAICCALSEGIRVEVIKEAVLDFIGPEGRLEPVDTKLPACRSGRDFKVFIDYAHTDNALENVLKALREITRNRLIVVFGCGGDRDRFKRPRMGDVASKIADYVVITSDNPRSEEPSAIIKEIEKGIVRDFRTYETIVDRRDAINRAMEIAGPGDVVLIAGKGHERYQIIGDKRSPFSDKEVVKKCLS